MAEKKRLFFAVVPDNTTRLLLAAHLNQYLPEGLPGKTIPAGNWHVTLRFLGSVASIDSDRVIYEASRRLGGDSFPVKLGGLGAFPHSSRAVVLWVGFAVGKEKMEILASQCEDAATAIGLAAEERPFHPHLTLARIRPPRDVRRIIEVVPSVALPFKVAEARLYESYLGCDGTRYTVIERFPL